MDATGKRKEVENFSTDKAGVGERDALPHAGHSDTTRRDCESIRPSLQAREVQDGA